MAYVALLLLLVTGCIRSSLGELSAGPSRSWSGDDVGVQTRVALGVGDSREGGSGFQFQVRASGETSEVAIGYHLYGMGHVGPVGMFGRAAINLLEWDRVGDDDGVGSLGPSLQLGITGPRGGPCVAASASRDLRLGHPDATFIGITLGVCAFEQYRGWR